jgi:hypothetical protein
MRNAMDKNSLYGRTMMSADIDQVEDIKNKNPNIDQLRVHRIQDIPTMTW